MKPITFAVPNSVSAVLYEIERLRLNRSLSELSSRLLQMFYVVGWDDGFMVVNRADIGATFGVRSFELSRALAELEALELIAVRTLPHDAAGRDVIEILAMSLAGHSGLQQIGWWGYYRLSTRLQLGS